MINPEPKYICDTDIWVKICIGNAILDFHKSYKKIYFSDIVENEILKWEKHDGRFNEIGKKFLELKKIGIIEVIYLNDQNEFIQQIIRNELGTYGYYDLDNKKNKIKNLGEYASAVYATQFEIECLQTDDNEFKDGGNGKVCFPDLIIKSLSDILSDIFEHKQRISVMTLIEKESDIMNKHKQKYKEEQEKNDLFKKLSSMQKKVNSRSLK